MNGMTKDEFSGLLLEYGMKKEDVIENEDIYDVLLDMKTGRLGRDEGTNLLRCIIQENYNVVLRKRHSKRGLYTIEMKGGDFNLCYTPYDTGNSELIITSMSLDKVDDYWNGIEFKEK